MRILIVVEHYLPGFKSGGPIRSVANMIEAMGGEAAFHVFTRDRDLADREPYPGVAVDAWQAVGRGRVYYASSPWKVGRVARELEPDVIYLNSVFSRLAVLVMILRRLGRLRAPIILAPRGELSAGALQFSRWKKMIFLTLSRWSGSHEGITWQATSVEEVEEIARRAPARRKIVIHTPLFTSGVTPSANRPPKVPGAVKLLFASRISPKKNLGMVLNLAARLRCQATLDIIGPIDDPIYWQQCRRSIESLPASVRVTYRGPMDHQSLQQEMTSSDLFVLPTHGENHGHAIVEALEAGCPVLVSDRTPWRGLESRLAGWDLSLDDATAFTGAIERIAAMNEEEHRSWRLGASSFAASIRRHEEAMTTHRNMFALEKSS